MPHRSAEASSFATSATALVALVALAATLNSFSGTNLRLTLHEARAIPTESTVRQVAAAVAAAARDLVAGERVSAAVPAHRFAGSIVTTACTIVAFDDRIEHGGSPPLLERFIDLPPPIC